MTLQEKNEIIAYFKDKELPKELELPGFKITDCRKFVEVQIIRIEQGSQIIKQVSYEHLLRLKEALEK